MNKLQNFLTNTKFCISFNQGLGKTIQPILLVLFADKISNGFNSGLLTGRILIDLQKAFDTIDHNILLQKLSSLELTSYVVENSM